MSLGRLYASGETLEIGLHFQISSHCFASPHYLLLENGVVLLVFSFFWFRFFLPSPAFWHGAFILAAGAGSSGGFWRSANSSLEGGNERFGRRSEPALAPSVRLAGEDRGASFRFGFEVGTPPSPRALSRLGTAGPGQLTPCALAEDNGPAAVATCALSAVPGGRRNLRDVINKAQTLHLRKSREKQLGHRRPRA